MKCVRKMSIENTATSLINKHLVQQSGNSLPTPPNVPIPRPAYFIHHGTSSSGLGAFSAGVVVGIDDIFSLVSFKTN